MENRIAGIVGGMGQEAGLDLAAKVSSFCKRWGRQPIRYLLINESDIPDRTQALLEGGPDFVPAIVGKIERLQAVGASFAALACNTAHARLSEIRERSPIPVLDMIDLTCRYIVRDIGSQARIGVLGTRATIELGLYHSHLVQAGCNVVPSDEETTRLSHAGILAVKRDGPSAGAGPLARARSRLLDRDASVIIMGCTEIPLAFGPGVPQSRIECRAMLMIDPTRVLAERIVREACGDDT